MNLFRWIAMSKKKNKKSNAIIRVELTKKHFFFFDWIIGNYSMSFFFEQLIEFLK